MHSGKRQKSYMPALDGPARAMIQGVGITVKAPPAKSKTIGSQSGGLVFKHTHTSFRKRLAQLSRHRDIRGIGAHRFPQGVAVATFWYKKTDNIGTFVLAGTCQKRRTCQVSTLKLEKTLSSSSTLVTVQCT